MSGLSDTIKKVTGLLGKKDAGKGGSSPFGSGDLPFSPGIPDLNALPDLTAGFPGSKFPSPGMGPAPGMPPSPPGMGGPGGFPGASQPVNNEQKEAIESNAKRIKEVESKLSKADVTLNMVQRDNEEIRKTVDKIDQSVLELLSLYEIVSNQVNPFVGDDVGSRATIERFEKTEKRITELADLLVIFKNDMDTVAHKLNMPGIPKEIGAKMQDIESKLNAFADAMSMLHESIEQLNARTEELTGKTGAIDQNILELAESTSNISARVDELERKSALQSINHAKDELEDASDEGSDGQDKDSSRKNTKKGLPLVRLENLRTDPTSVVVLLNWIEFLMERVGRNNLMDALDYYVDIGWISEDVRSEVMAYARGIDYYVEKPTWRLLPEDHTKSLLFIERLCGRKIDRNMLSSIDREMSKVKHGLEELYGI
ncbi:FlaD/FlaE family flagellar protein [Methanolobus chelungpuianus]|uniref:Flagella protein n=1 Tax=Methanolobus chelungpuianus TaxID=502115 RepID=A0AAE3KWY9_9EURY|nr:FlaD/FlaE family flagellar protein [Methanolobus chelungpuianus]MCQ6962750.1 flagella protein [Methanolobus chelungpuianus]